MDNNLFGKTAIVTGASSGIGSATAVALARAGAAVVLHSRRKERLEALAESIWSAGGKALVVAGDAGVPRDVDALVERAQEWRDGGGSFHAVVINAGRGLAGGIVSSDESQWQELYQTNVMGAAYLMRRAGKYFMENHQGDIVVVGSVVGRHISPFSSFYGSSKFAVGALAEALRREICQSGVRVSLVLPGMVDSEFQKVAGYDEENFGKGVARYGKVLQPADIAEGIRWLLTLPSHVNVNEIVIRPTGQDYP